MAVLPHSFPPRSRLRASPGFSLFELVIVLLIIGVAGALVIPGVLSGWESRQVRQSARKLAGVMRGLRERAVRRGVEQEIVLESDGVTFSWSGGQTTTLPDGVSIIGVRGGWRDADGRVRAVFYPNGGSSGLGVLVAGDKAAGLRFTIDVEPLLGSVHILEGNG